MKQLKRTYCEECKKYYNLYYFEKKHIFENKHIQNIRINSNKDIDDNIKFIINIK